MDTVLANYLNSIDNYLKPLPAYERADIIKEIQSEMQELQNAQGLTPAQITARLGSPKELAQAYLGDAIIAAERFSWKKFTALLAFYSLAGFGGLFVLPFLSVLSISLIVTGIVSPLAGLTILAGELMGVEVPYVSFQIGSYTPPPMIAFPISLVIGILLLLAGKGIWQVMQQYIRFLSKARQNTHSV